jgi:hypothetical protein
MGLLPQGAVLFSLRHFNVDVILQAFVLLQLTRLLIQYILFSVETCLLICQTIFFMLMRS